MIASIAFQGISKSFPGVKALTNVSFGIRGGEVHALIGENGAGKSTLMNILSGSLQSDAGSILVNGQEVFISSPKSAHALGIRIVHQDGSLVENLNVAENIFPENQPLNSFGLIDYGRLHQLAEKLLSRLGIKNISTRTIVSHLSPGDKQMVEIAKALAFPCKVLILDEPTASISYQQVQLLFEIIRGLKKLGIAIVYISHRMHEIREICEVVSALKDGKYQGTVDAQTTTMDQMINMMVGRDIPAMNYTSYKRKEIALSVNNLTGKQFKGVTFHLYKGEILGFAGLIGSGRTELAKAIFGEDPPFSGGIFKKESAIDPSKPARAIQHGIAYVPEERIKQGIFPEMSVEENITAAMQQHTWRDRKAHALIAEKYIKLLNIRTPSSMQKISKLSGGNQQKVILARWLCLMPDVLIVDEPTHGVDVGSKFEIYEMIRKLVRDGISIMLISSELPELLLLSDRIAVMHGGEIKTVLDRSESTEESIIHYASG